MSNNTNGGKAGFSEIVKSMNWPTVALVLLTGGGNWFTTQQGNNANQYAVDRAREQLNEMYSKIDEFETRQKETARVVKDTLDSQTIQIQNQSILLANQNKMLDELHKTQAEIKTSVQGTK